ncbi:hypothetical protein P879_05997 [Paragonimus westermani]|uniref:NADH-cytochrome b5 reductase n=1 Tax=Paragonimus westermani TaxID=34504 RepID=A0A8T0DI61_9TREM|nr:hypothetical protein P879_05997 [Paragonimus westermani]
MGGVQSVAIGLGSFFGVSAALAGTGALLWYFLGRRTAKITLVDPNVKHALRVVDRQFITSDTMFLKLGLDTPDHILGLPVGNHIFLSARINGELVVRPYTPISLDTQKGYVDFVIKVYKANVDPNFPNGGKMSQYLMNIPIAQYVDLRGPAGNLHYEGKGVFQIKPDNSSPPRTYKSKFVSMICGGSGITPMYQLINYILNDEKDCTKLALLFANKTEKDIILRDELEAFQSKYPQQLRVWYTVNEAPEHWAYSTGFVNEQMLSEHIYPPGDDSLVLLCGPTPMVEFACYPNLAKLNYPRDRIFSY